MDDVLIIKALREKQATSTQAELAKEIGVSAQFLSDVLKGRRKPSEKILKFAGYERIYRRKKAS